MAGIRDVSRKAYLRIREWLPGEPEPPESSPLPLATYTGHSGSITSLAFLPDNNYVISGSRDKTIRVWSLTEGHEIGEAIEIGRAAWAVAASGDGKFLASGGADGKVVVWDAKSHEKVVEGKERHSNWVKSLSFSSDSKRVASASTDKSVIIWSTSTGEKLAGPFTGHTDEVRCVAGAHSLSWAPDGNQIIAACYDHSIQIFDTSDGTQIARWNAHTGTIRSIAISRDGRFIVSGSIDNTVKLWDATTHQQISPPLRHDGWVRFVSISPDAKYIASGGDDKKVKLWSLRKLVEPSYIIDEVRDPVFMLLSPDPHMFVLGRRGHTG
ncbi:hypothetical protein HYDPIDRAFT_96042 [Hydnomerulius pinastri MD-312]|uniref:WD40 repeat-like protein n=1 Tax=Hydnomerulius pinastri MD-312 TaxID=994086 RepID=A0A0C2PRA1_9AGAM|nr:hypothetical protein HYDPIDRAFT_104085 [Hydnomerulius pinastri MD-312]KIJ61737.1 hypothetical protein HYDPIDRAFT_96042 [Hydnomerulius pinastri MD-312]